MKKALTMLAALAAAFTILTPAAAQANTAPVCPDASVTTAAAPGSFAVYGVYLLDFCSDADDDYLQVVSVNNWPTWYWSINSDGVLIDGIYNYTAETFSITVTDGTDYTTFNLTVTPI